MQIFSGKIQSNMTENIYNLTQKAALFPWKWLIRQCICSIENLSEKKNHHTSFYSCKPRAFTWHAEEASE